MGILRSEQAECVTLERRKKKKTKKKKRRKKRKGKKKRKKKKKRKMKKRRRKKKLMIRMGREHRTENRRKKMEYIKEGIMEIFYLLLHENDETGIKRLVLLLENPVELVGIPFMSTESDVITKPTQMLVQ